MTVYPRSWDVHLKEEQSTSTSKIKRKVRIRNSKKTDTGQLAQKLMQWEGISHYCLCVPTTPWECKPVFASQ